MRYFSMHAMCGQPDIALVFTDGKADITKAMRHSLRMLHSRDYITDTSTHGWSERFPTWLGADAQLGDGRFMVPPHAQHLVLTRHQGSTNLLSNICTHKQALIYQGQGEVGSRLVCSIHRWNWDHHGRLMGARGFDRDPCHDLASHAVERWRGHLWTGTMPWLEQMPRLDGLDGLLDISRLVPGSQHTSISYGFDWKVFMEIYLDLYHVAPFHPGLGNLTDPRGFGYHEGRGWSCQTAAFNRPERVDPSYRDVADVYRATGLWDSSRFGAVWLGIYPNTMLEFYPGVVVVSTVWPDGPGRCTNHLDFFYDPGVLDHCAAFPEIFERYFMRTADEDEEIGLRLQAGRAMADQWLPANHHDPEESGIAHFHAWLRDNQLIGSTTRWMRGSQPPL